MIAAIGFAEEGCAVTPRVALDWRRQSEKLGATENAAAAFLKNGKAPVAGDIWRFPALARTLKAIAAKGRDAFYTGPVAEDMVRYLQGVGGTHGLEDFAHARPDYVAPISTRYGHLEVVELPPNGQGIVGLIMLNILAGYDLAGLDPVGVERLHLEAEATDQFGFRAQEGDVTALLDRVASRGGGLVAGLHNAARGLASQMPSNRELLERASETSDAVDRARERLPDFFLRLSGFLRQQTGAGGDYDNRLLLPRAMRVQPDWADVELAWENLSATLGELLSTLQLLHEGLQSPDASSLLDYESLLAETADLVQTGAALRQGIGDIILRDDPDTICWLTQQQRSGEGVGLSSAPLRVAELLEQRLFAKKETAVLTGATLTTEGSFDYLHQAVGLPEANELLLGSPFDYAQSTMVLVPQDMPDPNQPDYMSALQQALIELVRASRGRALVLFTSHASLRAAYGGIKQALEEEQILALGHNIDGSPRQLIQALRDHPNTVVLGTASFWEGVDVVGEALSLLVIARFPFSVPNDPIFQARSELFDDPFTQYAVPQAALRFKQGFGRLIRRKTDRGVMVVLDGRIHSKGYGRAFLRSLPDCTVRRAPLREMPDLVAGWLGDESRQATPQAEA
ncbi:MAG: gamma-glutamyltransferase [Chloroflexi bacterium]|nr:gamma-glutamyltransferase [Chloroflexota bacterium]